ncbi:PPP1R8 [Cordylochernes scorpioides]|uniref:PPP1R8 n=1 Tax=Cordylochernes scorpioides TaxID=51811 RepID=A0ABY6LGE9_9ARAC|nr:PPP1R8 [Cordylochernes scorpioides]
MVQPAHLSACTTRYCEPWYNSRTFLPVQPDIVNHGTTRPCDGDVQKLMIDEKKCYLFGRNPQINDFCIDHASCSRVHAALVYHKHLNRAFLTDLGSIPLRKSCAAHGTYIGRVRLESRKPTQLPIDSMFHFGASTRNYILRERPQKLSRGDEKLTSEELGLPETETDLDNLTEFNTAQNRRISMLTISDEEMKAPSHRRKSKSGLSVRFNEEEEVINPGSHTDLPITSGNIQQKQKPLLRTSRPIKDSPVYRVIEEKRTKNTEIYVVEDIDPTIGKFRNLVQTAVIPTKKQKLDTNNPFGSGLSEPSGIQAAQAASLAGGGAARGVQSSLFSTSLTSKLGLALPNPAPDIEPLPPVAPLQTTLLLAPRSVTTDLPPEPRKKKYAKEAWPGKKAAPSYLV